MQFPESWLRAYADPPLGSEALADALTMAGLEVEDSVPAAPPFAGVVVARVIDVARHPDADKLTVCRVDAGTGAELKIVCGAPNVAAGIRVPCALVGAELPGGFAIKEAKMRGVVSQGMLCSARELGLSEDHEGLLILPADAPVGGDLRQYLLLDERKITIKLTPNRGDCLSVFGVAREVAAITGAPLRAPSFGPVPAGKYTFVATTTSCRRDPRALPSISSERPALYPLAVSKKLTPASIALSTICWAPAVPVAPII
jgi:phenylalanyl-tRNA synthetase beta chain